MSLMCKGYIFNNVLLRTLTYVYLYKNYKIIIYNYNINLFFFNIFSLKSALVYTYYKIIIKSKIYRIFSNKKKTQLFPHINYYHIIRLFIFFTNVINFKKKLILFGLNNIILKNVINNLLTYKKINIFTYRGFKLSRSITYKKIGKVAKYF